MKKLIKILFIVAALFYTGSLAEYLTSAPASTESTDNDYIPLFELIKEEQVINKPTFEYKAYIGVYTIDGEQPIRKYNKTAKLQDLGNNEYFSYCLELVYNGKAQLNVDNLYVTVDNGPAWHWSGGSYTEGFRTVLHIYYDNMKQFQSEGSHTVTWYLNDEIIYSETFLITNAMNWNSVFQFPSAGDIQAHNLSSTHRSPYIAGWLNIPQKTRYTEYSIDFKADYLPNGTYCCLGNWKMDYSALLNQYSSYRTEYASVQGYAGFQSLANGNKVAILSFWDIFCTDKQGNETVIRPQRIYPESNKQDSFGGEGTGAHSIVPYDWKAGHWYRMQLICTSYPLTPNTVVEQWVCDLETGEWTLLSAYDTGVQNATFQGDTAVFLENFVNKYSGEIRTMEIRDAKYFSAGDYMWHPITSVYVESNGGLPKYEGSYKFGSTDNRVWMITSGVGGDWYNNGRGQKSTVCKMN